MKKTTKSAVVLTDAKLRNEFKVRCAEMGVTMRKIVTNLIKKFLNETEV